MRGMSRLATLAAMLFMAALCQAQFWSRSFGNGYLQATTLTKDPSGNVYVAGWIQNASFDFLVLKYDRNGTFLWSATWNGTDSLTDEPSEIAVDAAGNVYVAGISYLKAGGEETAVVKYDANGNFQWASHLHVSTTVDLPRGVATDLNGGVYVAIDSGINGPSPRPFVIKLSAADGSTVWSKNYAFGVTGDRTFGFAADSYGHTYICGNALNGGLSRVFAVKTDGAGSTVWKYLYADASGYATTQSIALDSNNEPALSGYVGFADSENALTIKLDSHGLFKWKQTYDSPYHKWDIGEHVAQDPEGDVYVAVASSLGIYNDLETVVLEYSPTGSLLHTWTRKVNGGYYEAPYALTVDKFKRVYLLEDVEFPNPEYYDAILSVFDGGTYAYLYSVPFGGQGLQTSGGLVCDDSGYAVVGLTEQLDAAGNQAIGTTRIEQPPVGVADGYNVGYNHALTVTAAKGVLVNDIYAAGASANIAAYPAHGKVALNADGSFTYTPTAGFFGVDSFQYYPETTGNIGTDATVTLHILPVLASLTLPSSVIKSGTTAQATVTLNHTAPAGGTSVALMSSNTAVATVPAMVTVPAGQAAVNFSITAKTVAAQMTSKITATYAGNVKSGTVTVGP